MSTNAVPSIACDVKDMALAEQGKRRIEWAFHSMPVLQTIRKQFIKLQPLAGIRVVASLHVTSETANLMVTLRDGGASLALCASDPLSTQDDVAASLVKDYGISTFAVRGAGSDQYAAHVQAALEHKPNVTMDDGGGLASLLHRKRQDLLDQMMGGTEETRTGVQRLQAMARDGVLQYPVVAINNAQTKQLLDNRYGTGQSTIDGILRAANVLLAGLNLVVAGYGSCGRGVASKARGMGANVIVTEVDPIKGLEAQMDGYRVMSMGDAAAVGDVFVTVTGNKNVIGRDHFDKLKNGAILCNAGHFDVELDLEYLAKSASSRRHTREFVEEYALRDGRKIYVLGQGRLVNLSSAEGHPASVMDVSFANQALSVDHVVKNHGNMEKKVHCVPESIDRQVAKMKLEAMGVKIDRLTMEQEHYLASWSEGT